MESLKLFQVGTCNLCGYKRFHMMAICSPVDDGTIDRYVSRTSFITFDERIGAWRSQQYEMTGELILTRGERAWSLNRH